ncbi:hypothetical protein PAHAL_2G078000 [Panicum hallii]|uniref:Uncharacterized protein n=1 Tax=Panicum hallii TaxID=206008 RepID=A0A2S3GWN6_9POAL|nr:uncharacterized protein LOC112879579 isoform X2 [Panicum hallii]PAN10197.2 hypothetical protein PAHAL_2G078000 [Panicum hallii]
MPSLPRLAAPAPAAAPTVRRTPPALPPPLRPPCRACSLGSGRRPPRPPSATAADAPRGGPIPEPEEVDQHLLAALHAARIRDEESRRSDPLFIDPYAAVLLSHDVAHHHMDYLVSHAVVCYDHYRLTTRYIDDKLQNLVSNSEDIRQIVLLTDGMDTRPYRLSWPRLSVVYDVSPGKVFSTATRQLRGSGAKVSRNCVLLHTPLESPDLQEGLSKNGFNGNRLSLWVLQGLEQENLEKLFFTQGFQVSFVRYDDVVKDVGLDLATPWEQRGRLLFVAEQLRFSDAQMESFRMHFERIEEDADEDGFEEL